MQARKIERLNYGTLMWGWSEYVRKAVILGRCYYAVFLFFLVYIIWCPKYWQLVVLLPWIKLTCWSYWGKSLVAPSLLPQRSTWGILLKPAGKGSMSLCSDPGNHLVQKEFLFCFLVICKGRAGPHSGTSDSICWLAWGILETFSVHWARQIKILKLYSHRETSWI